MYKDLSDRYYPNNKVTLQKKANEKYQNLSGQKKENTLWTVYKFCRRQKTKAS